MTSPVFANQLPCYIIVSYAFGQTTGRFILLYIQITYHISYSIKSIIVENLNGMPCIIVDYVFTLAVLSSFVPFVSTCFVPCLNSKIGPSRHHHSSQDQYLVLSQQLNQIQCVSSAIKFLTPKFCTPPLRQMTPHSDLISS